MGFVEAVRTCFGKYVTFSGRATRPEYWWFFLFIILANIALGIVDYLLFGVDPITGEPAGYLGMIFGLAVFLPSLAVGWRRMHDTGRPGWYQLLPFAGLPLFLLAAALVGLVAGTILGSIVTFVFGLVTIWWLTRPSEFGANAYGLPAA